MSKGSTGRRQFAGTDRPRRRAPHRRDFAADRKLADLARAQRKVRRDASVRPLVDAFFAWARTDYAKVPARGLVATALGYSVRHEQALSDSSTTAGFAWRTTRERALRAIVPRLQLNFALARRLGSLYATFFVSASADAASGRSALTSAFI